MFGPSFSELENRRKNRKKEKQNKTVVRDKKASREEKKVQDGGEGWCCCTANAVIQWEYSAVFNIHAVCCPELNFKLHLH